MNKKVITFLSLFSLVLILSIYYVISPFGESNTPIDNNVNVNVNLNNEEDAYFVSLEVAKEEDYDSYIEKMNAIIASSEYSNDEKKIALENIEKRKAQRELEKKTCVINCGDFSKAPENVVERAVATLTRCTQEKGYRELLNQEEKKLVDGKGACRIANAIIHLQEKKR